MVNHKQLNGYILCGSRFVCANLPTTWRKTVVTLLLKYDSETFHIWYTASVKVRLWEWINTTFIIKEKKSQQLTLRHRVILPCDRHELIIQNYSIFLLLEELLSVMSYIPIVFSLLLKPIVIGLIPKLGEFCMCNCYLCMVVVVAFSSRASILGGHLTMHSMPALLTIFFGGD